MSIQLNTIYNEDCLETMKRMLDGFVDLTVTSPPYDNLRTYNGYSFDFESVAKELYRVTKDGGVVVWIVGDATIDGSETGTSFKQALYFIKTGFKLHDTMIWSKSTFSSPIPNRYHNTFEYMFVLSKGRPKTFNPLIDKPNRKNGTKTTTTFRETDGTLSNRKTKTVNKFGKRYNIWQINEVKNNQGKLHPAPFPEQLAGDHIKSWSNDGDLVYDPFMGSGTSAKVSKDLGRNYIGSEISKEYCDIAEQRLRQGVLL